SDLVSKKLLFFPWQTEKSMHFAVLMRDTAERLQFVEIDFVVAEVVFVLDVIMDDSSKNEMVAAQFDDAVEFKLKRNRRFPDARNGNRSPRNRRHASP